MSRGLPVWNSVPRPHRLRTVGGGWSDVWQPAVVLGPSEARRRLFHMAPGFLPFVLWVIPHRDPWGPMLLTAVALLGGGIIFAAFRRYRSFARRGERDWSAAVLGYALPVLGALLLLPGEAEIGLSVLGILALGDGAATLGGLRLGGWRLPWNRRKSWTGSLCFCFGGAALATLLYWGEAVPRVSLLTAFLSVLPATLAAALVESLPLRSNDNLRVGATALIVALLTHAAFVGW